MADLYKYLRNPYQNIRNIHKASKYLTNKHGIIKDVLRAVKSLPTLNYHLTWSSFDDPKKILRYEEKIFDFLEKIKVKKFVRDGLYEVSEMGTIVTCLRNNSYVQFLDIDDLRINRQRNGKWVVEFDLQQLDQYKNSQDKFKIIESLPDEVSKEKYNLYRNKNTEEYRYVELKNCDVIKIDGNRNFPWGIPLTFGAWASLIQKELINRVERSVADRLIKQVLILYAGNIVTEDKKVGKPPPKELVTAYFNEIKKLMLKKDQSYANSTSYNEESGTGVISLPKFMELDTLKVDTEMFKKDLYEKINSDIFMNLGVSPALIYGGDSQYASSQVSNDKFIRYVFTLLEDFEDVINEYIKNLLPKDLSCKFYFSKTTTLDRKEYINQAKEFYQQTGMFQPWAEAVLGIPYHYAIGQARYEKEILGLENIIYPAKNAHTSSGDDAGRPSNDNPDNPNTIKSKSSGGNSNPSPSD